MATLAPLDVIADLSLVVDGDDVYIHGNGDTVVVEVEGWGTVRRILQGLPGSYRNTDRLGRLHGALEAADLTVEVHAAGDLIARMGADAEVSAMSSLLRMGDVEVRAPRPALAAMQRQPGWALALGAAGVAGGAALLYFLFGRKG